jgi:hypothetical protein
LAETEFDLVIRGENVSYQYTPEISLSSFPISGEVVSAMWTNGSSRKYVD